MRWILGLTLTMGVTGLVIAEDKAAAAAKKLEGTYTVTEVLIVGKPSPKSAEIKSVEIKDGVISIQDGKKNEDAKFKLNPAKTPMEIDLTTKAMSPSVLGIYQTKETDKGLELTIAFIKGGGDKDGRRPKDFKGEGEDEVVLKLFRKK
jgi:uncharacterized protein (TIGR03067 family)